MMRQMTLLMLCAMVSSPALGLNDADSLYGIHWYGNPHPDNAEMAGETEAERMAPGRELWVLEINHLDNFSPDPDPGANGIQATPWDRPEWFVNLTTDGGHDKRVTDKGHSLIYRIQPNWGRNVPYYEEEGSPNNDPFTLEMYAAQARNAAYWHRQYCRFWQVGNEVNLDSIENRRWNPETGRYDIPWQPSPEAYAITYLAVRDAIHEITPDLDPAEQVVLMQANSPGDAEKLSDGSRYLDGNEFLYRQIAGVPEEDREKIDGFALHSYAEPGGENDGLEGFFDVVREQLMVIDQLGLHDRPVFITEFNKHMPTIQDAEIGARFVQRAYERLHTWNTGVGGAWPDQPNHHIVAATWFTFPKDTGGMWQDYSLLSQKELVQSESPDENPYYGFQKVASKGFPRGDLHGGGTVIDQSVLWWEDTFETLDTSPPLPDWHVEGSDSSYVGVENPGVLFLRGGEKPAVLSTRGYVYTDLQLELRLSILDAATASSDVGRLEVVVREGSGGYALVFEKRETGMHLSVRDRKSDQIYPGLEQLLTEDYADYAVHLKAHGNRIRFSIGADGPIPEWELVDKAYNVGRVTIRSTMKEVALESIAVGGVDWDMQ